MKDYICQMYSENKMKNIKSKYDVVIVGAGHNGLVAACYLAKAGLSVLVLEKNDYIGGATKSERVFEGVDVYLSKYSYLVSLLPQKIIRDLGISFAMKKRSIGSFTPDIRNGKHTGLLVSNASQRVTRNSFIDVVGNDKEFKNFIKIYADTSLLAKTMWPSLLKPMITRTQMKKQLASKKERSLWNSMVEEPLYRFIESRIHDDLVRGIVFTDAKIGNPTYSKDKTLLQNRTFLYHVIGQGTGIWNVPVGGMGNLVHSLIIKAKEHGVIFVTSATVTQIDPGNNATVDFTVDGKKQSVTANYVLINAAPKTLKKLLSKIPYDMRPDVEGTAFKMNMVLSKLPTLKSGIDPKKAFAGTFHIDERYRHMDKTHKESQKGIISQTLAGEMYCHTLTDNSILSPELRKKGYQTLTLFGIDIPYRLFTKHNTSVKKEIVNKFLTGINRYMDEPIESCIAKDANGKPCLEAKSALDLEKDVGLPYGNIFHTSLSWPFLEDNEEYRRWGVEIGYNNIFLCGSGALRGGCVSGIPGHNAAMKVFECISNSKK